MNVISEATRQLHPPALIAGITAVLVSGFWLWLAPPKIAPLLNAQALAEHLQPALIEALRPFWASLRSAPLNIEFPGNGELSADKLLDKLIGFWKEQDQLGTLK